MSGLRGLPSPPLLGEAARQGAPSSSTFRDPKKRGSSAPGRAPRAACPGPRARRPRPLPSAAPRARAHGRGAPSRPRPGPASLTQPEHRGQHRPQPAPAGRDYRQSHGSDGLCHPAPAAPFGPGPRSARLALPQTPRPNTAPGPPAASARTTAPRHRSPLPAPVVNPPAHRPAPAPWARPTARSLVVRASREGHHWTPREPASPLLEQGPAPGVPPLVGPPRRTRVPCLRRGPARSLPAWLALGLPSGPPPPGSALLAWGPAPPPSSLRFPPRGRFQVLIPSRTRICSVTPGWGRGSGGKREVRRDLTLSGPDRKGPPSPVPFAQGLSLPELDRWCCHLRSLHLALTSELPLFGFSKDWKGMAIGTLSCHLDHQ